MLIRSPKIPSVTNSEISEVEIRKFIGNSQPTILEIGCNDGSHTLWLADMFPNSRIYCFEPDPRAIERFREKIGHHPRIELFEIAMSDRDGEIEFFQSAGFLAPAGQGELPDKSQNWDLSGSIRRPKNHLNNFPTISFNEGLRVRTTTLDKWCQCHGIGDIDFIWMDVQGAELDVFRGGKKTLSKTRLIYTEYSDQELYEGQSNLVQLVKHLKRFEIVTRYSGDVLFRNKWLEFASNENI